MRKFFQDLRLAQEERVDGKAETELEIVIYARLADMTQLSHAASKEMQEQWMIRIPKTEKNAGEGSCRVRKSQIEGADANYFFTTKVKKGEDKGSLEATLPCSEDMYNMYRFLADEGMVKDRYRFPIQGSKLVWEVDVFKKPDGSYHDWVKIDLEITNPDEALPELPMQFAEVILPEDRKGPDQEKYNAVLDTLYSATFKTKNQFVSGEVAKNLSTPQDSPTEVPEATDDADTAAVPAGDSDSTTDATDGDSATPEDTSADASTDEADKPTGVVVVDSNGNKTGDAEPAADAGEGEEEEAKPARKATTESFYIRF